MPSPTPQEQGWTLDLAPSAQSLTPTLAHKSAGNPATNPKTDIVVAIVGVIVVAVSRTAVFRIVVPRTAPQQSVLPVPSLLPRPSKKSK